MMVHLKHQHRIELYYMSRNKNKQIPRINLIKVMKFEKAQHGDAKQATKEALSVYSKQTKLKKFAFQLCEIIAKNKNKETVHYCGPLAMSFVNSNVIENMWAPITYDQMHQILIYSPQDATSSYSNLNVPNTQDALSSLSLSSSKSKLYALQSFTYEIWEQLELNLNLGLDLNLNCKTLVDENNIVSKVQIWKPAIIEKLKNSINMFMCLLLQLCAEIISYIMFIMLPILLLSVVVA